MQKILKTFHLHHPLEFMTFFFFCSSTGLCQVGFSPSTKHRAQNSKFLRRRTKRNYYTFPESFALCFFLDRVEITTRRVQQWNLVKDSGELTRSGRELRALLEKQKPKQRVKGRRKKPNTV